MIKSFFKPSDGSFKCELKFLIKKILINLFIVTVLVGLYHIFR
jgi:meiotically up-regulated gene 157 (Mug157) protein